MKFIDSLKNLFSKKEEFPEKKKITLQLEESIEFLKKFSDEDKLNEKLTKKEEEITKKTEEIKNLLKELNTAEIPRNIRETTAVESKVLSNRGAYIGFVNILLKKLESRTNFEESFNDFSDKSIKSYYTTQYLFGKELLKVSTEVQNLSKLFIDKKSLNKELKENKFKITENNILLLQDTLRTKNVIKNEIAIIEKELKRNDPLSAERRYVELKNSQEYRDVIKMRDESESNLRKNKEQILELFSDIKRILKKANNQKKSWIVQYYIDEPLDALIEDEELKIISFIKDIKKEDVEGESLEALKLFTEEKLKEIKTRYRTSLESTKKAEKKQSIEQELSNLEDSMFRLNAQKTELVKKLEELKKRDLVNPEELKKDIENNLTSFSGSLIEIEN